MKRGTIFNHTQFRFKDGTIGNKYIILLNTPVKDQPHLFCKTTSHEKYCIKNPGCHAEKSIYFLKQHCAKCMSGDTWVQLHEIYEISGGVLVQDKFKGHLREIGGLDDQTAQAVVNCVKKTDDVTQYQLDILG